MASSIEPGGPSPGVHCPKCLSTNFRSVVLTGPFVYLRCSECAEVWAIPERRQFPRRTRAHRGFPGRPDS
jgi:uncharacterized Zn finger protein